ncbi:hypothetical protein X474_17115 [Dethiosulfatarculus sandiegensis]|uniref:Uncharacterized protein n=1 Tax=Dethiosulfatarculus sandiegensis TaxID=1429043 RepID=A0A0D2HQS9_9BACT|nr:hypothetical protein X474_17115 [Dethiosulfatarculus sandiegensis]
MARALKQKSVFREFGSSVLCMPYLNLIEILFNICLGKANMTCLTPHIVGKRFCLLIK